MKKSKIRKILEKYQRSGYRFVYNRLSDVPARIITRYIRKSDFDKLEKELQELVEYEKELARQQEQDAQDMINAGVV